MMNNHFLVEEHVLQIHADVIYCRDKGLLDDICKMFSINQLFMTHFFFFYYQGSRTWL